jgi:hypothetical protein
MDSDVECMSSRACCRERISPSLFVHSRFISGLHIACPLPISASKLVEEELESLLEIATKILIMRNKLPSRVLFFEL